MSDGNQMTEEQGWPSEEQLTILIKSMAEEGTSSSVHKAIYKPRVLFVDDEANVLSGIRRMLCGKRSVWDMEFAGSGQEALERCEKQPYDIIVSDMRMPGMTGVELLTKIQKRWPHTIRFILSGNARPEEVLRTVGPVHQYIAKPCDSEILQAKLEKTVMLHGALESVRNARIDVDINSIPSFPTVYRDLQQMLNNDEATVAEVAQIVEQDPVLTLHILKMVNSAYFSVSRVLSDVSEAIAVIGLESVQAIMYSVQAFERMPFQQEAQIIVDQLWDHSQRCALIARRIMKECGGNKSELEAAFFAGLVHDLGHLILLSQQGARFFRTLMAVKKYKVPLHEAERAVFKVTHADLSGYMMALWGISDSVIEPVLFHHDPLSVLSQYAPDEMSVTLAVHLAEVIDCQIHSGVLFEEHLSTEILAHPCVRQNYQKWLEAVRNETGQEHTHG